MKARAAFAALVALFVERPRAAHEALQAQASHTLEADGLVSEQTAFRVRSAFERFSRSLFGGGR